MEEEQQLAWLRQHRLLQRQQQHHESRGVKRRTVGLPGAKSYVDLAGHANEADQAEESGRASANERRLVGFLIVDHGAGHPRIRHAQAKVQILFLLRSEPEDRRGPNKHDLRASQVAAARGGDRLHRGGDADVRGASGTFETLDCFSSGKS